MKAVLTLTTWAGLTSVCLAQQGQVLPRLGQQPGMGGIQKNGLPAGFGANGFNGGINNNNGFNNQNPFNAMNNRGLNPAANPFMNNGPFMNNAPFMNNPFMNNFAAMNPYYNAGYNPFLSPYNTGFGYPGFGYPGMGYFQPSVWQSYNINPWTPGAMQYGNPFGPYGQLPQWYNGVSPAPIVGISGPPFGMFPSVQ